MNYVFALGADDPEMSAIEALLKNAGQEIVYASKPDGNRVTPVTAYNATITPEIRDALAGPGTLVFVECAVSLQGITGCTDVIVVDHHRAAEMPMHAGFCDCGNFFQGYGTGNSCLQCGRVWRDSDPGYGKPAAEYWQASSIGQVCSLLGIEPTAELLLVAAADHCLAAAYAGQCPGVDPAALAEYRIEQLCSASRASNRGVARTPEEVRESIAAARTKITISPEVEIGTNCAGQQFIVLDMRGDTVPDLPEAACQLGVGYLAGGLSLREGDPPKIVLGGCGEGTIPGTAPVEAFLAAARSGEAAGVRVHTDGPLKPYGDPARGFAGAYIL